MKILSKRNYLILLCMSLVFMFTLISCGKSEKNDNTVVEDNKDASIENNEDVNDVNDVNI